MTIGEAWAFLTSYPQVLAALITFLLGVGWQLVTRVFSPQPRLRWGDVHQNLFNVPVNPKATEENPNPVAYLDTYRTRNYWVTNAGNGIAEDVEIVFNWRPAHMQRWPAIPATEATLEDGRFVLTVARLNPRESLTLSLLSLNAEHPDLLMLRCKGHGSKRWNLAVLRQFGRPVLFLFLLDMILGVAAAIYLLVLLMLWIF